MGDYVEVIMQIAFWGLGSIAKRHIRNMNAILKKRNICYRIDVYRHTKKEIEDSDICQIITGVYEMSELSDRHYDVIFITNPTSLHFEALQQCIKHADCFFIEKPVFADADIDLTELPSFNHEKSYVACPLRYTNVFQYLKGYVDLKKVISVQAVCSSYLPDWRPGTDYRTAYCARRDMGGGVAIDLIHEWDYLTALFDFPQEILYAGGKYSGLEIDSDDLAVYLGLYKDKVIELHLDYFGRKDIRQCKLFLDEDVIVADFLTGHIDYLKSGRHLEFPQERDLYQQKELLHFMDIVEGRIKNDSTITHALKVLKLTAGIL